MNDINTHNPSLSNVHSSISTENKLGWRRMLAFIGPAYLVSVGYMDPGNWATDIAGGSAFGYRLIWVLFASNLIALLLQSLSARLGIVRGLDLAQASKNAYPKLINFCLYILAQIAIIRLRPCRGNRYGHRIATIVPPAADLGRIAYPD